MEGGESRQNGAESLRFTLFPITIPIFLYLKYTYSLGLLVHLNGFLFQLYPCEDNIWVISTGTSLNLKSCFFKKLAFIRLESGLGASTFNVAVAIETEDTDHQTIWQLEATHSMP